MNDNRALVTVQVCQPQITQFRQADTSIPQQPENSAIASSVHVSNRANFMRRRTGFKHPLELFKLDDAD